MLKARLIRWIIWTVIVSAVVFELGENLWALLAPPPPLQISPATTWIIEPLAPDGLPDYFRAMLTLEPRAIPAESNAAAAVWELIPTTISSDNAIDHSPAHLSAADQVPASERLVMPPPPPDGMEAEEVESILETCARFPWRAADHPWLARWLDDNSLALDRLAAGARREGWCPPRCLPADRSPTDRFGPTTPLLMSLTLPVEGALRSFSNVLLARSMLSVGEGDIPGAWHDIDTLLRYGDKIADSPGSLVCRMVAMTLFARAAHATRIVILDGHLDDALLADMQRSLHSAIDWAPLAESVDTFERLSFLDAMTSMFADPTKPVSWFSLGPLRILALDPNVPLTDSNRYLAAMVDAANQPTRDARRRASQEIEDELEARKNAPRGRRQWFQPWHEVVSEGVSRKTLGLLLPGLKYSLDDDDRAHASLVLADCAAALERYRLATGQPPASLADLVPAFLSEVPLDPFTDTPIGYRIANGRWTLWSGAVPEDDAIDDLVVRGPAAVSPEVPSVP
jgi:hypothetical protein